jgi:hypothetical protein
VWREHGTVFSWFQSLPPRRAHAAHVASTAVGPKAGTTCSIASFGGKQGVDGPKLLLSNYQFYAAVQFAGFFAVVREFGLRATIADGSDAAFGYAAAH